MRIGYMCVDVLWVYKLAHGRTSYAPLYILFYRYEYLISRELRLSENKFIMHLGFFRYKFDLHARKETASW